MLSLITICALATLCIARTPPPVPTIAETLCAACIVVLEEVEGLASESGSKAALQKRCATFSGSAATICDIVAAAWPTVVQLLDAELKPAEVCVEVGVCVVETRRGRDLTVVEEFVVDLDSPPAQRWNHIVNETVYWGNLWRMYNTLDALLSKPVVNEMMVGAVQLHKLFPEPYKSELEGVATATSLPLGFVVMLNIFYELTNHCTSIVAQDTQGRVMFARNQDLGYGMGFTGLLHNQTIHVQFKQNGKVTHEAITFAGYVGVPTGYVPNKFAVSLDTRFYNGSLFQYVESVWEELMTGNWTLATWAVREAMEKQMTYAQAHQEFSNAKLINGVYYILGGLNRNEGVVIAREQKKAAYERQLSSKNWYLLQTNYETSQPAPWYDDRRKYGNEAIKKYCANGANVTETCLLQTLNTRPVLNLMTVYSAQAVPGSGAALVAYHRICHDGTGENPVCVL